MSNDATLNKYCLEYSYADLNQATSNFDPSHQLGSGSYGAVFRGIRRDGTEVAIKVLELPDESGFEEEVRVLSKFRHPNLVILMGFARRDATRFLVYELLGGGDVYQRLQKSSNNQQLFTWKERCSAACDAACGLSHLHNSNPKVFHRDIKTANILLDRNGTAKMADFGLACLSHSMAQHVEKASGTTGYACPLYAKRSIVTEGSEVYSYGMVMLEMLTATPPAVAYQASDGSQQIRFLVCEIRGSVDIAVAMADSKAQWPLEVARCLARLALRCADDQEEKRPDFAEIVNQLRQLRDYVPQTPRQQGESPPVRTRSRIFTQRAAALPPLMPIMPAQPHVFQFLPEPAVLLPAQQDLPCLIPAQPQPAALMHMSPQAQPAPSSAQQAQQVTKVTALWTLRCIVSDDSNLHQLGQDSQCIFQWQEVGHSLCTTMRVGRLFQDDFFKRLLPDSANLISREHFQIWAEPLHMPGLLESTKTCIPCSFFLTNFSANGTLVNNVLCMGESGQVVIHSGDTISIPTTSMTDEGPRTTPLIQFQFDLSGSILQDTDFATDNNTGIMGGA